MNRYLLALTAALGCGFILIIAATGVFLYIIGGDRSTRKQAIETVELQINYPCALEAQQ